jgi:hypothetical protein
MKLGKRTKKRDPDLIKRECVYINSGFFEKPGVLLMRKKRQVG